MRRSEEAKRATRLQLEKITIEIKSNITMLEREVTLYSRYCRQYKMKFACRVLKGVRKNLATRKRQLKEHLRKIAKYRQGGWI